jgi:hypothetical protein
MTLFLKLARMLWRQQAASTALSFQLSALSLWMNDASIRFNSMALPKVADNQPFARAPNHAPGASDTQVRWLNQLRFAGSVRIRNHPSGMSLRQCSRRSKQPTFASDWSTHIVARERLAGLVHIERQNMSLLPNLKILEALHVKSPPNAVSSAET